MPLDLFPSKTWHNKNVVPMKINEFPNPIKEKIKLCRTSEFKMA